MYQRSRNRTQSQEWDPMRDEYEESTFAPQYQDNDTNAENGVQLDHCKLYVRNISKALNQEGLKTVFAKYGNCLKVFLSNDPTKRYALVTYETPSEAKLAMMKLNRTDPLQLHINVAHKSNRDSQSQRNKYNAREDSNSYRDEDGNSSGKARYSRKQDEFSIGENNNMEDFIGDEDLGIDEGLDTNLVLEMEELKLKHLKLQEAQIQCKQRMILLNRMGKNAIQKPTINRCMLPDGRIVVRNNVDRLDRPDVAFNSAAGDSPSPQLTLPALQRTASRACLACSAPADAYCARCGLAPYCSARCQQVDWVRRHRDVCHNLARVVPGPHVPPVQAAAPLRRPHSPNQNTKRNEKREENTSDKPYRNQTGGQNKAHRTNPNLKNHTFRPPRQCNKNTVAQDEESFEPKDTKPSEPEVQMKPAMPTKAPEPPVKQTLPTKLPESQPKPEPKSQFTKPTSISDATPVKKMVPKNYVVETLSVGDTVLLSVDATGAACKSESGHICLSLHEASEQDYQLLCVDYSAECDADNTAYKPKAGELFSFCNPEDQAWYRARLLNATQVALIDSSKVVKFSPSDKCRKITPKYENIPEFCCVLDAKNIQVGESLKATLTSKTADGCKVLLENTETGASLGEGVISRWKPEVEYIMPKPTQPVTTPAVTIPVVERPDLINNSKVLIVEASALDAVYVRPFDRASMRKYDMIIQDVLEYSLTAKPIQDPPQKGQVVIAKSTDGNCYRALCKRTNVSQNKYLLEYIELGNTEISTKEAIYACPPELSLESQPTLVSLVKLPVGVKGLTAAAVDCIETLKDTAADLTLTIIDGSKSALSGAEVKLTINKNNECLNKKLEQLCSPSWKKIEVSGGDVIQAPVLTFNDLEHLDLPENGCVLDVLDLSTLSCGSVNVCVKDLPYAKKVFTTLTDQMAEYCNSEVGREPYLPNLEELCIAQCPPYPQWFRGVVCERVSGPGGAELRVCFVDYGNVDAVPVALLRKMMPDFVRALPALATHAEIRGFPKDPSDEILLKAYMYMKVTDEGRGELTVTKCEKVEPGFYIVDAPGLLKAIGA